MTLFKQIALMLSIFLTIILAVVLTLNFQSANESVQERLYENAKNTAASLSLSLGSAQGDTSMMATMINANFDSGHYTLISLKDTEEMPIFERTKETQIDVPQWFQKLIAIEAPIASAQVSAGWSQVGVLSVQSDNAHAYKQLYTILKSLLISFSILALVGLGVLNFLLHTILRPLKQVQFQAEAVTNNEFIVQNNIPYTKEFKDVVIGMNSMVVKVKAMFEKGNEELKRQKEVEYTDNITKLKNRKYFIDKLPEFLKIDATSRGGVTMLIAFQGVIEANSKLGHRSVDGLFMRLSEIFKSHASNYKNSIVARMNGTEFVLFLPDCDHKSALDIATSIQIASKESIVACGLESEVTYLAIGIYAYTYNQSIAELLSFSDNALGQAKFHPSHIHFEQAKDAPEVMGKEAWRAMIQDAIEANRLKLTPWRVVDTKKRILVHNVLTTSLITKDGQNYSYGQFMAPANQIGLGTKIYESTVMLLFKKPDHSLKGTTCSLRLSSEFLHLSSTYELFSSLLKEYAKMLPYRLIVELPDALARENSAELKLYKSLFEQYGVGIGIFEFIGESSDYRYLQELRPVYIKAEQSYFLSQSENSLSALKLMTQSVGIILIATSVMEIDVLQKLQEREIFGIQGRATEKIAL